MSAAWVAVSIRARAMTRRRVGRTGARQLAGELSLASALARLAAGPYGHDVRAAQSLAEAQRGVVASLVWNVRVLAGWAPRDAVAILRVLAGLVEIVNVEGHLARLGGHTSGEAPVPLGALATEWPRLSTTADPNGIRTVLAGSAWGDPGTDRPRDIVLAMRLSLADRVVAVVPRLQPWAAAATALTVASVLADGERLTGAARRLAARVLGPSAAAATDLASLRAALPESASWVFDAVTEPAELWRAQSGWWRRVERDSATLLGGGRPGPDMVIGAVGLLAVDAWRVRAALELATRGGQPLEVFDAVA